MKLVETNHFQEQILSKRKHSYLGCVWGWRNISVDEVYHLMYANTRVMNVYKVRFGLSLIYMYALSLYQFFVDMRVLKA